MTWNDLRTDRIVNNEHIMQNFEQMKSIQRFEVMTTAQRIALVQSVGKTVYDSDIKALFASDGANWVQN